MSVFLSSLYNFYGHNKYSLYYKVDFILQIGKLRNDFEAWSECLPLSFFYVPTASLEEVGHHKVAFILQIWEALGGSMYVFYLFPVFYNFYRSEIIGLIDKVIDIILYIIK